MLQRRVGRDLYNNIYFGSQLVSNHISRKKQFGTICEKTPRRGFQQPCTKERIENAKVLIEATI